MEAGWWSWAQRDGKRRGLNLLATREEGIEIVLGQLCVSCNPGPAAIEEEVAFRHHESQYRPSVRFIHKIKVSSATHLKTRTQKEAPRLPQDMSERPLANQTVPPPLICTSAATLRCSDFRTKG